MRMANYIRSFLQTNTAFYLALTVFVLSATYIAVTSVYPMAFDEEFHLGMIRIYASSWLPYGIEHSPAMAQYGAATADASYLFHYLMSFPYRFLVAIDLPENGVIIVLRLLNVALAAGSLVVFRRAILEAGISRRITNVALAFVMIIPVFIMLAAHINYDNLLLLVMAWCVLLIVRITTAVRTSQTISLSQLWQLAAAILIGMSIKYAFLPLALGMFIWLLGLVIYDMRRRQQSIWAYTARTLRQQKPVSNRKKYTLGALAVLSLFFASHYISNAVSYGSPIPSCDQVFTETECQAYGPWKRNKEYEANKDESFRALSYPAYMIDEWFPDMAQRLTFAVAGKTNDFQTKLPLPLVEYGFVVLSVIGFGCLIIQALRRKLPWLTIFAIFISIIYAGVLSVQLYGDYVATAEPVAINGRYLIPLLPLVGVGLIHAIRLTFARVSPTVLAGTTAVILVYFLFSGAGIGTYIMLAEQHWFWPGFGQGSHSLLRELFQSFVLPQRFKA